jgi:predicted DNA-binding transcriptional regulator AlpA
MDRDCISIAEFCERNSISRAFFYIMQRDGTGPRLMRVGSTRVLISQEAAAEWRRERTEGPRTPKPAVQASGWLTEQERTG